MRERHSYRFARRNAARSVRAKVLKEARKLTGMGRRDMDRARGRGEWMEVAKTIREAAEANLERMEDESAA